MLCGTPASRLSSVTVSAAPAAALRDDGENLTSCATTVSARFCGGGGGACVGGGGGGGAVVGGAGGADVAPPCGACVGTSVAAPGASVAGLAAVALAAAEGDAATVAGRAGEADALGVLSLLSPPPHAPSASGGSASAATAPMIIFRPPMPSPHLRDVAGGRHQAGPHALDRSPCATGSSRGWRRRPRRAARPPRRARSARPG